MKSSELINRRDVKSRNTGWAQMTAKMIANAGISPNMISTLSMLFSFGSLWSFYYSTENKYFLILAVIFIQLRLLCNLFDGMVAVEFNKKSIIGELYNEVPDRISDFFIIIGAGIYSQKFNYAMDLAWGNIFLATLTAYLRTFGASITKIHFFLGPMAKQHRMFLISASSIISIFVESAVYWSLIAMLILLTVTNIRRLKAISNMLKSTNGRSL